MAKPSGLFGAARGGMGSAFSRLTGLKMPRVTPMREQGVSGTAVWGGYPQQREKSSEWVGRQKYITSTEMASNISIVAAGIHYFLNLISQPSWTVRPSSDEDQEAIELAEWTEMVLNKMTTPWYRVVRKAGMFRFHGFGIQEWTAIRRDDGTTGLKDVEARPQHTIERWEVDLDGTVTGVWQRAPQTSQLIGLPRGKLLYLVDDTMTDSPEGLGIFRHLGASYNRLKQYIDLETRAYERDLRGIPIGRMPLAEINAAVKSGELTEAEAAQMTTAMENILQTQVKGNSTSLLLDSAPYRSVAADGDRIASVMKWAFELLKGDAAGQAEIAEAIERTQREMARIIGCEQLMMHGEGARALSEDKSRNTYLIANSVLRHIVTQTQHDIIDPLWMLNGYDPEKKPELVAQDVAFKSVQEVTKALTDMATAGAVLAPNDKVIDDVRDMLGVSRTPTPEENEEAIADGILPDPEEEAAAMAAEGEIAHERALEEIDAKGKAGVKQPMKKFWNIPLLKDGPLVGGVKVSGPGKGKAAIRLAWNAIPEADRDFLTETGIELFTVKTIEGVDRNYAGLAVQDQAGRLTVSVADTVNDRKVRDAVGTATCELGRAVDYAAKGKRSEALTAIIMADFLRMSVKERDLAVHYGNSPTEMFAELYRLAYSPAKKGAFVLPQKLAEKRFARSLAALRGDD